MDGNAMDNGSLKPMQPWGANGRTIWAGERNPFTGRVPVHVPHHGPHAGGPALRGLPEDRRREQNPQEYAAGFRARMAEIPSADERHPSWRAGWNDADTELLEQARHRCWLQQGREDNFPGTRRLLFDAGRLARENGVPFDPARTEPWMEGWVAADIELGAAPAL